MRSFVGGESIVLIAVACLVAVCAVVTFLPWFWIFAVAGVLLGGCGIWLLRCEVAAPSNSEDGLALNASNVASALFLIAFGAYSLFLGYGDYVTRRAIGLVVVAFSPDLPVPGDTLEVSVRMNPRGTIDVQNARIELECTQATERTYRTVRRGYATSRHVRTLWSQTRELTKPGVLEPGQRVEAACTFVVPRIENVLGSDAVGEREWRIAVRIDRNDGPSWQQDTRVRLGPPDEGFR